MVKWAMIVIIGFVCSEQNNPDSKVHGANMGPIWGRQDPGGPHVGPMNFAIWDVSNGALFLNGILVLSFYIGVFLTPLF